MSAALTSSTSLQNVRRIICDTETTGVDKKEDRVVEIGGVEVVGNVITGNFYHQYISPGRRKVHPEALKVHGLTDDFLATKPTFDRIYREFLTFVGDGTLVFHNAPFDIGFLTEEFARLKVPMFKNTVEDTLVQARKLFPNSPANLDALMRRFGIDGSRRTKHGALLDSELLAEVYIKMHRLDQLALSATEQQVRDTVEALKFSGEKTISGPAQETLVISPRAEEIARHNEFLSKFIKGAFWGEILSQNG